MNLFELDRVSFRYDETPALQDLTLSISAGTRVAILGANGSGKSTLLRLLDALAFPSSGTLHFDGRLIAEAATHDAKFGAEFRRRVGLVFQNPDVQLFNPTVFDELAFGPLQLGWPEEKIRERIDEMLVQIGIEQLRDRSPHRLSNGEKKRVALASILIVEPEVLLLDEPTAALDPRGQSAIIDLLQEWSGRGRTIITATHDLGIVEDIADHAVIMQNGSVAFEGAAAEIIRDEDLLRRTGLLHAHRHAHEGGVVHTHPHRHHDHPHE